MKQDFVKKGGPNQNFPHKEGGWSKRGGGLERLRILRGGGLAKKRGANFLRGEGHTLVSTMGWRDSI